MYGPNLYQKTPRQKSIMKDWQKLQEIQNIANMGMGHSFSNSEHNVNKELARRLSKRFNEMKKLARKYAPFKLRTIEAIERLCNQHMNKQVSDKAFIHRLRLIAMSNGANIMHLNNAEAQINMKEQMRKRMKIIRRGPQRKAPKMTKRNPYLYGKKGSTTPAKLFKKIFR